MGGLSIEGSVRLTDAQVFKALWRRGLLKEERQAALQLRDFARYQLGIELHVGQLAFAGIVLARRQDSHIAKFLTALLTSGNRAGKTAILSVLIIYSCLGKLNLERPDETDMRSVAKWGKLPYHWYHFGIRQEVSDLVFEGITQLLTGTFGKGTAQPDGCPLTKAGPIADWDSKEYSEYQHIRFRPEVGGAEIHFRTTGAKALGTLGRDMNGITFDEPGLEPNLDFLMNEVFGFRRLGTGGQLILASTPSEELGTAFADNWEKGNPLNPKRLDSWNSMRISTRDNIGYGLTQEMFDILTTDMDERTILQNVEGFFLQAKAVYFNGANVDACFLPSLPEMALPKPGLIYLQGVDPAKTQDSAWAIVLAVVHNSVDPDKPYLVGVRAAQKVGQKSTDDLVTMAYEGYAAYERPARRVRGAVSPASHCYTALDATGFGGKMFREALEIEVPQLHNVEFGGTTQQKRKLLGDLRTVIDEGRLLLPKEGIWTQVRRQLLAYKEQDRGLEQDAVMALVCAIFLVRRAPADGQDRVSFDLSGAA